MYKSYELYVKYNKSYHKSYTSPASPMQIAWQPEVTLSRGTQIGPPPPAWGGGRSRLQGQAPVSATARTHGGRRCRAGAPADSGKAAEGSRSLRYPRTASKSVADRSATLRLPASAPTSSAKLRRSRRHRVCAASHSPDPTPWRSLRSRHLSQAGNICNEDEHMTHVPKRIRYIHMRFKISLATIFT